MPIIPAMLKFYLLLMGFAFLRFPSTQAQPVAPVRVSTLPELLEPGKINSENPEFATAISPDGRTIWFNRTAPDRTKMTLLEAHWDNDHWSDPYPADFADSMYNNIDPMVHPDGKLLVFTSNRPLPGQSTKDYNLWLVQPGLTRPEPLPATINTDEDEVYASIAANKNLYFARFSGKKARIFVAKWQNNTYLTPEQVHLPNTDTASISNPAISPDEDFLVFASAQLGGFGAGDIFISRKCASGEWSTPQNLGPPINSAASDFAPSFSADGKALFFTSERPGIVQEFPVGQRRPGDLYGVQFDKTAYPTFKIARDPEQIERLIAINRDIWAPFSEAYAEGDVEQYMALHTPDFIRANTNEVKDLNAYRLGSQHHFDNNKKNNRRCEIAFSFLERVASASTASERGIYRYTSIAADGTKQNYYGKFHVFHRYINGKWKIAVDYDSDEGNTIGEADFKGGLAPEVFEDLKAKPFQLKELQIRDAAATFSQKVIEANWDAVAALYAEDAKVFPPGSPILEGFDAIRAFWASAGKITFHKITPIEIKINGSEALDWGVYEGKSIDKDNTEIHWKGKYTIVWKEISPGDWKIYLDIWNRLSD